ncbi:uncharacterized protein LOC109858109 isoform X2 [Pseudomyrmex gracilis]|uniref:uncharacterized protein LOC109858109 isoform X2 n=1 Tax=Pseudomyrmex gracilis TaxID=219809 RepID=UPI0009957F94|nr:uncharacterized protein LOC109858109 isoform X2 [Pseudomyrmex gracilis]
MNNPYRARPARSRVDHSAAYGMHNQNTWMSMPRPQSDVPSNDATQQSPLMNQSEYNSWKDPRWDWSLDQQSDIQQPQQLPQQQSQQQQHYVSFPQHQGQLRSNSAQDNYYKNLQNGNTSDVLNQNSVSGRNTPRSEPPRQTGPNYTDPFSYTNYNQNQQYPLPPQQSVIKSGYEHNQWSSEQQTQNAAYTQQRLVPQQNQKDQPLLYPPPVTSQNFNRTKDDAANLPLQRNWQNHTDMLTQDQNVPKDMQQHVDNMSNQGMQSSQMYNLPVKGINKEHSINWSANGQPGISEAGNRTSNQWHNQNRETMMSSHLVQTSNIDDTFSSWPQMGNANVTHDWRHSNVQTEVHSNQWLQQVDNNAPKENVSQDNNSPRFAANEWQVDQQQMHASFHYATVPTTTVPTTVENIVHTSDNNKEQQESEKQATTVASATGTALSHDSINVKPSDVKPTIRDHNLNTVTDDTSKIDALKNVLVAENDDYPFVSTVNEDLSSNFGQLNLGNKSSKHANHSSESLEAYPSPGDGRAQHSVANFNVTNIRSNSIPDNIPVLPPDYASNIENSHSVVDSQPVVSQNHQISNTYQNGATKVGATDSVSQSGYDQWYNQSARTTTVIENAKEHTRTSAPNQWSSPKQNVENYENIQLTSDFMNVEVVAPDHQISLQERDIYGSRDSINKETLDNDPKPSTSPKDTTNTRDFREEINNIEVLSVQQQIRPHASLQAEQMPDNYEFASSDRNTFLETGELTDSHQEHEPTPSQDDENDEVPNDIPFLREVPGQSSTIDPRRNDPTGQEHHVQTGQSRLSDPRRNDPSGQEQSVQGRNISDRVERRDVLPGQERNVPLLLRGDAETLERRNDPSGRERSLPPQQSRNDPSGEERYQLQSQIIMLEPSETREVLGRGNEPEETAQQTDTELRQIPGGASSSDVTQLSDDNRMTTGGRVVTGSPPEILPPISTIQDQTSGESRSKREEAVGASQESENQGVSGSAGNRRDSYEDEDDKGSRNSRDENRERRREASPDRRRNEYDTKNAYHDRDREYDDEYYYDRRRVSDNDRQYNARDDFERRDVGTYRDDDRKHHSRDDLDRYAREDVDRRIRGKEDPDERDGRRRLDDRRKDRDRRRDDRRPRRYNDYDIKDPYRRDHDDRYGRGSRPSSRSSYNDRDCDYYYPPYGYGYGYNAHYDYHAYHAYARYAEWYNMYSQHQQQQMARGVSNYPEDRASVHSGRSSCDDRTAGDKRTLGEMSTLEDSTITSAQLTPTKFFTSHAYGCFSIGSLVHVPLSYPADGERAKVDIFRLDNLLSHDPLVCELRSYLGPLITGVTHKKTIIEYCENKIRKALTNEEMNYRASYILLYELMIMLIQQNGKVVGVDIAALLLRNKDAYNDGNKLKSQTVGRRESQASQRSSATGGDGSTQDISSLSDKTEIKQRKTVEEITDEYRDTLLYGRIQEALEYAMNEGLWGHALFLASKLDKRTYASVMIRFANSLPPHDPLQTLYQLHSGRVPAIVTCVADSRWEDWRPHLAMIISNTSSNPEINRRSITTLGDTLFGRGDIYAAHFCYILAQIEFGSYGTNGVKLVLIGANQNKPYSEFLTNEAVMLTEIYEYARNLSDSSFTLVDLQTFKFDLTLKMVDCGLIEKALLYIEQIATNIANEPSKYKKAFIRSVYELGDRLKYHDPVYKHALEDVSNVNLVWLEKLEEIIGKSQDESVAKGELYGARVDSYAAVERHDVHEMKQQSLPPMSQQQWTGAQSEYSDEPTMMAETSTADLQTIRQPLSLPANIQDTYDPNAQYVRNMDESVQYQSQDYWNQQPFYQGNYGRNEPNMPPNNWQQQQSMPSLTAEQIETDNLQQQDNWNYEPVQPKITMTPSSTSKQYDPLEELDALETPRPSSKLSNETKKASEKTAEKKPVNSGGSWFGGLISKFAPKPRNQMILPDDSNPKIVWDPETKKWTNKDEDSDSGAAALAPPPKMSDISFRTPTTMTERNLQPPSLSSAHNEDAPAAEVPKMPTGSNMYKLPKNRSMRANYVDIINPNGPKGSASSNMPTPMTSPLVPMATSSPQLFVPAPVNDSTAPVDFLTPATTTAQPSGNVAENTPQTLSRWSSTSSLSREVQSYTMRDPRLLQRNKGPMMFNPSDIKDHSVKNMPPNRYPPR